MTFPRIVCTLGKTTDEPMVLRALAQAGMGMARINTAYATLDELAARVDGLRAAAPVPVMLDIKGPQLRVECTTERVDEHGQRVRVPARYPVAKGDFIYVGFGEGPVCFNADFRADLVPSDVVTFQNGTIRTRVAAAEQVGVEARADAVLLEVLEPGEGHFLPQTGANVPGKRLSVPRLSARDRKAIALGVSRSVEWYALSFVRDGDDIAHFDSVLREAGDTRAGLCAKIEERQGIAALEGIVQAIRAASRPASVMIARGDLFVELPFVELPRVQEDLLLRCRALSVPSIVATGLLLSMQQGLRPARSEVCDVAAAARAGADSFLLSDETSNGKNPAAATALLAELLEEYAP